MKIGIVGTGMVGSTAAYAMVMQGIGGEFVLIDYSEKRAQAEAEDILHAIPYSFPAQIRAGAYADLAGCKAVVVAAGVNQKPGETRLELLERNAEVFATVIPRVLEYTGPTVLIIATNPVDIMTYLSARHASSFGIPSTKVIGSGTTLDTARFRSLLGGHLRVDAQHVHTYVVGEHGDSEVLTWSTARVGGMPLEEFCRLRNTWCEEAVRRRIDETVRKAAYRIIEGKGATYYGIGAALARIVDVVIHDQRSILTVSTLMGDAAGVDDVALSLPHLVGGEGILQTLPLPLDEEEQRALAESAKTIRRAIDALGI